MNSLRSILSWLILFLVFLSVRSEGQPALKRYNLFDFNWKFHKGGALGAESPSFDDSKWRSVDLPHDWSIEDLPGKDSPFDTNAISQVNGGFTTGGTGWYRKSFILPKELTGKKFLIMFEGVYMNAEVWINGEFLGNHPYGYTSFWFDISDKIKFDHENILSLKVKNEGENSRWYSGSGIYRHVWLEVVSPVHISEWGTYLTTPKISDEQALINVKTSLINNTDKGTSVKLITKILNSSGTKVTEAETEKMIAPGKTIEFGQEITLKKPDLWSTDSPVRYKAISYVYESEVLIDQVETFFGIRSISFDAVNGFLLNGKPMKLRGGCVHNDNGILGSKAYDRAEERRVELLKSNGFNAIRSSHNPPSPAFLEACDRNGMLVIDESFDMWKEGKNPFDYHLYFDSWWRKDIESMILRDRNHPSVIMWSIGNEIPDRQKPEVVETAKMLSEYVRLLDPTRPVTSAVNDLKPEQDPYFALLDVAGYNYASGGDHNQKNIYETDHDRLPWRIMVGTESYPLEAFGSWTDVVDHTYVIGDFVWTAFDYIGEASIGWRGYFQKQDFFPWNLAFCGDLDICGWKRAQSYYRDVLWNTDKVSIWVTPPQPSFATNPERQSWSKWHWSDVVSDWNWKGSDGKLFDVNIYSSCSQVELLINGKSLGLKTTDRSTKYSANWKVPYEAGTLRVIGFNGNKKVASDELHTSGEATQLRLSADRLKIRSDGQDLSYITIEVTDNDGIRNPKAENLLSFHLDGPGTIAGVGNGNPTSLESFQLPYRKAWHGKCLVIIKSDMIAGKIILKVTSPGLVAKTIEIESNKQ